MVRRVAEQELESLVEIVRAKEGASAQEIARARADTPLRTVQYRLKQLVSAGRLVQEGKGPSARYRLPRTAEATGIAAGVSRAEAQGEAVLPLSKAALSIQKYVRGPSVRRKPVGYDRDFLDSYRPNESAYLSEKEQRHLRDVGTPKVAIETAGTYARQILNRLLIDLSFNSSRLEGNTYSLLDTKRLIELGEEPEGGRRLEAQMILNHKDAIEFLVSNADEIGFNRYTILNLHAMLANNLLADAAAAGRLRHIEVGIERSVFQPLAVPQLIGECFDQILATTAAIDDPFEQAFFFMVQAPYLQPFDDVNKRVSRLAANIPLIKSNLTPLTFIDVPRSTYTEAMLGVYEMNKIELLKEVFIWAYERSAARYVAARQSLGDPDPFRLRHRAAIGDVITQVVRSGMKKKAAVAHLNVWAVNNIRPADRDEFKRIVESELIGLHEGNFARYRITPAEFRNWQQAWAQT
jgi:Fic family protein